MNKNVPNSAWLFEKTENTVRALLQIQNYLNKFPEMKMDERLPWGTTLQDAIIQEIRGSYHDLTKMLMYSSKSDNWDSIDEEVLTNYGEEGLEKLLKKYCSNNVAHFKTAEDVMIHVDGPKGDFKNMSDYNLTFGKLARLQPDLLQILNDALKIDSSDDPHFCAETIFYRQFKPRLKEFVGFNASTKNELLLSSRAYEIVLQTIHDALPDCRDCGCLKDS